MRRLAVAIAVALVAVAVFDCLGLRPGGAESGDKVRTIPIGGSADESLVPAAADVEVAREPAQRPSMDPVEGWIIECVDANSRLPLPGCKFSTPDGTGLECEEYLPGRYQLTVPRSGGAGEVIVSCTGYLSHSVGSVRGSSGVPTVVAMQPQGGVIRGQVFPAVGDDEAAGSIVVAWPVGQPAPSALPDGRVVGPGSVFCFTGDNGEFELFGVSVAVGYRVVAVREGAATRGLTPAQAGDALALRMVPVFGAIVQYVEAGGRDIQTNPRVHHYTDGITYRPSDGAAPVDCPSSLWRLCGIPHGLQLRQSGGWEHAIVVAHEAARDSVDLDLRVRVPGYRLREVTVELPRVRRAEAVRLEVPLDPVADGWADLAVVVQRGQEGADWPADEQTSRGLLHLDPVGRRGQTILVPVSACEPGTEVVQGIPVGDYTVTFRSKSRMFYLPGPDGIVGDWRYTVGPYEGALVVDLSDAGAIRVSGIPSTASAGYLVVDAGGEYQPTYYSLDSREVIVDLIVPGECRVAIADDATELAAAMTGNAPRYKTVSVRAGRATEIDFGEM